MSIWMHRSDFPSVSLFCRLNFFCSFKEHLYMWWALQAFTVLVGVPLNKFQYPKASTEMGYPGYHSVSNLVCPIQCSIVQSAIDFHIQSVTLILISPELALVLLVDNLLPKKYFWGSTKVHGYFSPWITTNSGGLFHSAILYLVYETYLQFSFTSVKF